MNRRQKIIISVTGIFLVLLILIGLTYGYYLTQIEGNEEDKSITVTTSKLELVYSDNAPELTLTGITPITTDKVKTEGLAKKFTISKTNESSDVYATIKLTDLNVSENIAVFDLKWALYQGENLIKEGNFDNKTTGEIILATDQFINSTTGKEYSLYIWINETGVDQSSMMNGLFSGKIDVIGSNKKSLTLANVILGENNQNVITDVPNFVSDSTDRGLYVAQGEGITEGGKPTYYFRGSATNDTIKPDYKMNNYVKFGKYKTEDGYNVIGEDIVWRIVRINEDGTIRLISQSIAIGYYDEVELEEWFDANFPENDVLRSKVQEGSYFCEDNLGFIEPGEYTNVGNAYRRLWGNEPSPIFACPTGATLKYSYIGLITADEVIYSGAFRGALNTNNPTYLDSTILWTATPSNLTPYGSYYYFGMDGYGYFYDVPSMPPDYRVVINLKADVSVTGGDGLSRETAYVIG